MQHKRLARLVLATVFVAVLGAACGGGGSTELAAGKEVAAGTKAAAGTCGFAANDQDASATQAVPKELTQADLDKAVNAAPGEIKGAVRVFFQTMLDIQDGSKEIQNLPPAEQAAAAMQVSSKMQSSEYKAAMQDIKDYTQKHCPQYSKSFEMPTQ